jgi:hypothetical protein
LGALHPNSLQLPAKSLQAQHSITMHTCGEKALEHKPDVWVMTNMHYLTGYSASWSAHSWLCMEEVPQACALQVWGHSLLPAAGE